MEQYVSGGGRRVEAVASARARISAYVVMAWQEVNPVVSRNKSAGGALVYSMWRMHSASGMVAWCAVRA